MRSFPAAVALALAARLCVASAAIAAPDAGEARTEPPRLFDSHEALRVDLEADWSVVQRDRAEPPNRHPAKLSYAGGEGSVSLPVQIETRGRSRRLRDTCEFPPLLLDIPKGERKGTLFRGIGELKLVTHCRRDLKYEQNVLLEYLVYRSYGTLTDDSHRVRLLQIRYFDPGARKPRYERAGFVIEDAENLAERLGAERVAESRIDPAQTDARAAGRVEMFLYLIGMTDFSMSARPDGPCCHNVRMLRRGGSLLPIPYDFDQTGVVDPPYALPDPRLGLRGVTERLFRGLCRAPEQHAAAIAELQAKRAEITALFDVQQDLSPTRRKRALAFLDGFYTWAADPARVQKTLGAECRKTSS